MHVHITLAGSVAEKLLELHRQKRKTAMKQIISDLIVDAHRRQKKEQRAERLKMRTPAQVAQAARTAEKNARYKVQVQVQVAVRKVLSYSGEDREARKKALYELLLIAYTEFDERRQCFKEVDQAAHIFAHNVAYKASEPMSRKQVKIAVMDSEIDHLLKQRTLPKR